MLLPIFSIGQTSNLLEDFRQHNLLHLNSSLLNPTFSYDRNDPRSVSLWTRYQWQSIDGDPTTLFLNYSQRFGEKASGGLGFFQNNTATYQNTGGILNVAFAIPVGENSNLFFGTNVLLYSQEFFDPAIDNAFGGQLVPAVRIQAGDFNLGVTLENALNFNFTDSERDNTDRIFNGLMSYDFGLPFGEGRSFIRPQAYVKSIPNEDLQYGMAAIYSHPKFYLQGGYNSYYSFSGGFGVTFAQKLTVGGLVETATNNLISPDGETFELFLSFNIDKQNDSKTQKQQQLEEEQARLAEEQKRMQEEEQARLNREAEARRQREARQDSIQRAREAQSREELERAKQDSIAKAQREREVVIEPGEKYEEVAYAEGLEPGFYLIANVFGTQRYFENFMQTLESRGLNPKSFFRKMNGYNYVYLKKYNTIEEARAARNSNYDGRYNEALWIFRVRQ